MPEMRSGDSQLANAYRDTNYVCWLPEGEVVLHVGQHAHYAVLDRFEGARVAGAAIITACNPLSEPQSQAVNTARNEQLRRAMERCGASVFEAEGRGDDPGWKPEASFLGIGMAAHEAMRLALEFGQFAFVEVPADGEVMLTFTEHWRR